MDRAVQRPQRFVVVHAGLNSVAMPQYQSMVQIGLAAADVGLQRPRLRLHRCSGGNQGRKLSFPLPPALTGVEGFCRRIEHLLGGFPSRAHRFHAEQGQRGDQQDKSEPEHAAGAKVLLQQ